MNRFEKDFLAQPTLYKNYESLAGLLTSQYLQLSATQRKRIRMLMDKSSFSSVTSYTAKEPGIRIIIKGNVTDEKGNGVAGARIIFFQTNATGHYAPNDGETKRMSELDSRLYGVMQTGKQGEYELGTIKPASYPILYEGRPIPQHIHFNIDAPGYTALKVQIVFDDDPAMRDEHWRKWAKELNYPIVKLVRQKEKIVGTYTIALKKQ